MERKSLIRIAVVTGAVLLVPLVAMLFSDEVNWQAGDFVVAGVLIFAVGVALEFIAKKFPNPWHQIIAKMVILLLFFLVWAELAVGLFGTPWAGS